MSYVVPVSSGCHTSADRTMTRQHTVHVSMMDNVFHSRCSAHDGHAALATLTPTKAHHNSYRLFKVNYCLEILSLKGSPSPQLDLEM